MFRAFFLVSILVFPFPFSCNHSSSKSNDPDVEEQSEKTLPEKTLSNNVVWEENTLHIQNLEFDDSTQNITIEEIELKELHKVVLHLEEAPSEFETTKDGKAYLVLLTEHCGNSKAHVLNQNPDLAKKVGSRIEIAVDGIDLKHTVDTLSELEQCKLPFVLSINFDLEDSSSIDVLIPIRKSIPPKNSSLFWDSGLFWDIEMETLHIKNLDFSTHPIHLIIVSSIMMLIDYYFDFGMGR